MKPILLAALIAVVSAPVSAQQTTVDLAQQILSEGRVLSSANISTGQPSDYSTYPSGTRKHELFVSYEGAIYLCYLTGNADNGTAPWPTCFGHP
ncbi:hypothetical protein [Rhodobacter sp. TJ_12]|uniref:hypothetical protein n=1 Tax=Rhodobacter sp. TJ_12 TaxID=2029399 RepID=UPI001CBCFB59|nr:hypothetical protein [Rhodobacter sp. TJ_12]